MSEDVEQAQDDKPRFDDSPAGLQRRWLLRLKAAKDFFEDFHAEGETVVKEFRGEGGRGNRLNLFYSDVQTRSATLSGTPKVRARRRYSDARDHVARVSALTLDRILNSDIERESDGYRTALACAKHDYLCPGLGQVWLRYVVETKPTDPVLDPEGNELEPAGEEKAREDVETDYTKWRRFLIDPAEVWDDVRAIYRDLELTKSEWEKQFPDKPFVIASTNKRKVDEVKEAFGRAQVWEIWDKETRRVLHLSENATEILKVSQDPYGLPGFFPCPRPLMANLTTSKCLPRSTYYLAKDQYDEAHRLQVRIRKLVDSIKVCGFYDAGNEGLKRLLDDASDGKLVAVKNMAVLVDKGGVSNMVMLLPIKERVEAIIALSERLALVKREIYEITGQSDIMRGQAAERATATEQRIKARFGSSRIQSDQDELARFASEAQRIRAFLIAKFFDAETIAQRANIQPDSEDAQYLPDAIALLKSSIADYRIDVDADSLAMTDYDAIQQDGTAVMTASGEFFAKVIPTATSPEMGEFFLRMYQQWVSGFRGADRFEPIIERFSADMRERAQQPPPPPQPDPTEMVKAEAEKAKAGAAVQKAQIDVAKAGMDMQAKQMDMAAKRMEHGQRMEQMGMQAEVDKQSFGTRMAEIRAKHEAAKDVEPAGGDK